MAKNEKRQILSEQLTIGIHAMLDDGFEAGEVARRVVRLVIKLAGERYVDEFWKRQHALSPVFTPERLRARQAELEAEWGGPRTERRVTSSLDAMAKWAAGNE